MTRVMGLDLGGTNVKAAVLAIGGEVPEVVATDATPSQADRGPAAVVEVMVGLGRRMALEHGPVAAVGAGVPGLFDFATGEIVFFTNLPGAWEGVPLRSLLAAGLGVPATLINDARAFTLAEGTIGAGRGCRTVACLTLGTGVGGGIMVDGRLHFGAFGVGGEIGHQVVDPSGPVCGCGNRGCMEALTRGPLIAAAAGKATVEEVIAGMEAGDERCRAALDTALGYLAIGLANVVTVLGPDRIVIGGGIADAGETLLAPLRHRVRRQVTLVPREGVDVVAAELGTEAGAIGAALAALGSPVGEQRFLHGEIPSATLRRGEPEG